ncbi:MAG TPA: tetratricopeptide repeat protein [Thermoanaerobaculia bacterium]
MAQGQNAQARSLLEKATAEHAESRHLHQLYAELLWQESKGTDIALLRRSAEEAVRAAELGLRRGKVDYALTARLAATLGRTGNKDTLNNIFQQILAKDPSSTVYLDYATGLSFTGEDPAAERAFQQAVRSDPNGDAVARYGEWLLDHRREREALDILPKETPVYYIHFLRGVALERLGRAEEARASYDRYRDYSRTFPAPARFRIAGSTAQSGIRFEDANNV